METKRKPSGRHSADHALAMAIACGATIAAAAQKAGLGERTVYRRMKDPAFKKKVAEVRSGLVVRTASMLSASGGEAVKTLLELQKPEHPPTVRLGASKAILEVGMRLRELADLEQRVAELEERTAGATTCQNA